MILDVNIRLLIIKAKSGQLMEKFPIQCESMPQPKIITRSNILELLHDPLARNALAARVSIVLPRGDDLSCTSSIESRESRLAREAKI